MYRSRKHQEHLLYLGRHKRGFSCGSTYVAEGLSSTNSCRGGWVSACPWQWRPCVGHSPDACDYSGSSMYCCVTQWTNWSYTRQCHIGNIYRSTTAGCGQNLFTSWILYSNIASSWMPRPSYARSSAQINARVILGILLHSENIPFKDKLGHTTRIEIFLMESHGPSAQGTYHVPACVMEMQTRNCYNSRRATGKEEKEKHIIVTRSIPRALMRKLLIYDKIKLFI